MHLITRRTIGGLLKVFRIIFGQIGSFYHWLSKSDIIHLLKDKTFTRILVPLNG
jgi:hypothetical protein